jgi:hypothetical protein
LLYEVFAKVAICVVDGGFEVFKLAGEPLIRIGLSTNASSVSITTGDSALVAVSPDEQSKLLATNKVTVSARAYRPPEVENYRIEFQNLPTQTEATTLAREIREATGETAGYRGQHLEGLGRGDQGFDHRGGRT